MLIIHHLFSIALT